MMQKKIPSLNWLRVFEAAAETESFTAAAGLLNMSSSAVSQQINALEAHLNAKLFIRGSRHVELTERGLSFLPTVRNALGSIELSATKLFSENAQEHVVVHAVAIFATSWLAPRLPLFLATHPTVQVHIVCMEQYADYRDEEPDIRISFGPMVGEWGAARTLFSERIFAVATPEMAAGIKTPTDLMQHRLFDVPIHRFDWLGILTRDDMPLINSPMITNVSSAMMALSLASTGNGLALARSPTTNWIMNKLGLVPCLEGFFMEGEDSYCLSMRPNQKPSNSAELFTDWIMEQSRNPETLE